MCRRDDKIDVVVFCKVTDIKNWRTFGKDRLKFDASKLYRPDKFSHLALGIFARGLLQAGNVVQWSTLGRIDVPEVRGVQQNDPATKFICEPDRVLQPFLRASGEINRHEHLLAVKLFFGRVFVELVQHKYRTGGMLYETFFGSPQDDPL